jgi:conjugal transfer pilus assembly protein TraE
MNHFFKQQSLQEIVKYNKLLLGCCCFLSVSTFVLGIKILFTEERWVLVPANDVEKRIQISSKGYSEVYLKEWAYHVMQTLMSASYDTVDHQVEELKAISSNSSELSGMLKKHADFIKGSNVQSVFFPKGVSFEENAVVVSGLFRYWLGSSEKAISQERSYRLTYKRGPRDVILLKEVKEITKEDVEDK